MAFMWSSVGVNNPSKIFYIQHIIKLGKTSIGFTETCQKGHEKINVDGRIENETHTFEMVDMCKRQAEILRHREVLKIGLHMVGKMSMDFT
jgi:hypothetical protein